MKTRKLITGTLTFVFLIIIFAFLNTSKAAISNLGYVKITRDRTATVKYTAKNPTTGETAEREYTAKYAHQFGENRTGTKNVWKLVTCTENGTVTEANYVKDLYCLRAGLGFTTETGGPNYNPDPVLYNIEYNMIRDYEAVRDYLSGLHSEVTIFNNEANFNSVMWILDHMLLEGASDEELTEYLIEYAGYNNEVGDGIDGTSLNFAAMKENVLTRADIEAIQQMAIWYFTNVTKGTTNEISDYHSENLLPIYTRITGSGFDTSNEYRLFSDIFNTEESYGTKRQEGAARLYKALIEGAKKAAKETQGIYKPNRDITVYLAGEDPANEQPIVEVKEKVPVADIALRKFISGINGEKLTGADSREPEVDTSKFNQVINGELQTTAIYRHPKKALPVKMGDVVTYTIRIYNEGEIPAYIKEVTDHLPPYMQYMPYGEDDGTKWGLDQNGETAITTPLFDEDGNALPGCKITGAGGKLKYDDLKGKSLEEILIPAAEYNVMAKDPKDSYTLSYVDIEISAKVMETAPYETALTNFAEVTEIRDEDGNLIKGEIKDQDGNLIKPAEKVTDRDSISDREHGNFELPEEADRPSYKDQESNNTQGGKHPYVPGQEDDDDFDKVMIVRPEVDLSLRKFISAVDGEKLTGENSREPKVDTTIMDKGESTTSEYNHTKKPIMVNKGGLVTYTIRVYNEGEINAYVSKITDYLPNYLIYLEDNETNKKYGWKYDKTTREVTTTITAENNRAGDVVYKDRENGKLLTSYKGNKNLNYIDVEIVCKVDEKALGHGILTNLAQITEIRDEEGNIVEEDRDSKPAGDKQPNKDFEIPEDKDRPNYKNEESKKPYVPGQEDDDDFEKVLVRPDFDLALRKFITGVNDTQINNRVPEVSYKDGHIIYNHTKVPVELETNNIVTYTIRVYNEGEADGYANEITDDMPEGLEFLPDNNLNKEYRWKMLDEEQKETTDVSKAKYIVTDYLSEEQEKATGRKNQIKAFNKNGKISETNPDYKEVKVAFKVTYVAKTTDEASRIIVNVAQISADSDDDIDSVPKRDEVYNKDGKNEDDIDYDNVKVKYFDLSLLKWVSQTKVTLDGKTVITDTGHTAATSKNEAPVKLEIESKHLKKINIKYVYTIQITNEGEIEGYADEIKDYIPEGLKFIEEDNKEWKWKEVENGVVTTDYLKNTLLKPGETATVQIVLTWINNSENLGEKINLAEISKDRNDSDSPDVDSTPDNKVPGEDDIDDAPVILAVKTGTTQIYFGLISIILITFISGVSLIKKYVLE